MQAISSVARRRGISAIQLLRFRCQSCYWQRFQSSQSDIPNLRNLWASHLIAGLAGGAVVVASAYTYFHVSGIKKTVDTAVQAQAYLEQTMRSLKDKSSTSTLRALGYLREATKIYFALVPGAGFFVDIAFDSVHDIVNTHAAEANAITKKAYEEVMKVLKERDYAVDLQTSIKLFGVLKPRLWELQALGVKAGGDAMSPVWDRYPEVKEKVDGNLDELKKLARERGPEAQRVFEETRRQVTTVFSDGMSNALERARSLIKTKTSEVEKQPEIQTGKKQRRK